MPGKPDFKQLWPTQFMSISLPGHDTANPVLADHLLSQNAALEDMTVDYTSDNLFTTDHPALIWLRQCCDRAVLDYARHAGIDYNLEWILQGWANVNMRGDYHNLHNYPHSWLSKTYYVSVPYQSDAEHRLLPNDGDLFLWPAFLDHLVHPNMADMPRISVSFNVVLKWKNEYIPV